MQKRGEGEVRNQLEYEGSTHDQCDSSVQSGNQIWGPRWLSYKGYSQIEVHDRWDSCQLCKARQQVRREETRGILLERTNKVGPVIPLVCKGFNGGLGGHIGNKGEQSNKGKNVARHAEGCH